MKIFNQKTLCIAGSFLAERLFPAVRFDVSGGVIFTDNFAPVESLMKPLVEDFFPKNLAFIRQLF